MSAEELHDLNTFAVVLAEKADGDGMRLEVQRALSFDEQDRISGQDNYCLCTEEGATHYGGVISWAIAEGSLTLLLDSTAAATLGVEGGFIVELPRSNLIELRDGLERILGPARPPSPQ